MWRHRWPRPHDRQTKWSTNGKSFIRYCTARPRIGVSERALAVLNALISFYPETTLTGEDDLIVFPSNEQLCLRTHGMPASTLRRQLAALVDAGLIVRRDSPNGKRYARKGRGGEIKLAFGFDLAPLVVRAEEFERLAQEIEAETRADQTCKREDHALPPRHRENDRHRDRGGRSNAQGRAGARKLAGDSRRLSGAGRGRFADSEKGRTGVRGGRSVRVR